MPEPTDGDEYAETAGDPAEAADLPATTGRDAEAGTPDTEYDEQDGASA
ncbi:hypothetical protein OG216_26025 [Streptomycetaceae bacterium NBC_01309]